MEGIVDPAILADVLARHGGWGVAAVVVLAWAFERRQNLTMQNLLLKVSTAGLKSKEP